MKPRPLGNSGLLVSPIGLGLAALGRPGYINLGHEQDMQGDIDPSVMEARAHAVLDAAWAAGVRYFDAARSYGAAERFLGNWLRSRAIPRRRSPSAPSGATPTPPTGGYRPSTTR